MDRVEKIPNLPALREKVSNVENLNGHKTLSYVIHKKVELMEVTTCMHGKMELAHNGNLRWAGFTGARMAHGKDHGIEVGEFNRKKVVFLFYCTQFSSNRRI